MFHSIPPAVQERMRYLEEIDARDRADGTPQMKRLRQVSPEVGKFIAIMAGSAPKGPFLEIGASAGYSTLWLAMACRATSRRITTFEILPEKAALARETYRLGGVDDIVELLEGDARSFVTRYADIAFCFLDAEKEVYEECYELVVPRLVKGGLLIADNAISHRDSLQPMLDRALQDERVDALIVPIGLGDLVCRKI
jgi:predicted O-methyltransferase YrrM